MLGPTAGSFDRSSSDASRCGENDLDGVIDQRADPPPRSLGGGDRLGGVRTERGRASDGQVVVSLSGPENGTMELRRVGSGRVSQVTTPPDGVVRYCASTPPEEALFDYPALVCDDEGPMVAWSAEPVDGLTMERRMSQATP